MEVFFFSSAIGHIVTELGFRGPFFNSAIGHMVTELGVRGPIFNSASDRALLLKSFGKGYIFWA